MRKSTKKVDVIIVAVIILLITGVILFAFLPDSDPQNEKTTNADTDGDGSITYKDYAGKTIGVGTGSMFDVLVEKNIPAAKLMYFNTYPDMVTALETGKVDAICIDEPVIKYIMTTESHAVDYIKEPIEEYNYGFSFQKTEAGKKLRDEFNEYLRKIKADGTMAEIENKWFSADAAARTLPEIDNSTAGHGVLRLGVESLCIPFVYVEGNRIVGYEVDIVYSFCKEYGYGLEVRDMSFDAIIPSLVSGMVDFGCSSMNITEERAESVYFSEPDYVGGAVLAVRASDIAGDRNEQELVPDITFDKLNSPDCRVGVGTGTAAMFAVEKNLPEATEVQFPSSPIGYEALRKGKIDAFVFDRRQMQTAIDNGFQDVMLLDENLGEHIDIAAGISRATKIPGLKDSINQFLSEIRADGTLDDMYTRWVVDKDFTMPETGTAASPELTLVVGTCGLVEPYSFYADNTLTGYDIELAKRFAFWLNADIKFKDFDYLGLISAAQSGNVDCIFGNLNVTPERQEVIDFSDPIITFENAVMVRAVTVNGEAEKGSWLDSIASSFEKNFIREDRWKMIVEGIGTTCLITVLSMMSGTVLAFLICMFRRTGSRLANAISDIYVKLLQGTPIVVLLMILYYVLLGKSGLEAVWVAVIGFTLNFGAYASEIMRSGIGSIDGGQREAALALGYSENQAFFRFIFPQAAVRFIPVYKQEIVSLLKSTSIVGYIAIQDLTKMSDIIRSRTYETFFPLIATAIIYFILAWIISLILKLVLNAFDRRHTAGRRKYKTFKQRPDDRT